MTIKTKPTARRFQRCYFVYVLAGLSGTLYVGLTDDLRKRMTEHKAGLFDGFTRKYKVDRLMYFETYNDPKIAGEREQQIKRWRREKKIALFAKTNPQWRDLTLEILQVIGVPPLRKLRVGISEKA
ncbi:MAG TPA: GIY-YIG nuclease family protein [Candidatus Angelobacter sp.]|jgi:putative endonuclease|nr:GIY-YIG nuclease family protein [Candidatus Angelobacter sp.]